MKEGIGAAIEGAGYCVESDDIAVDQDYGYINK